MEYMDIIEKLPTDKEKPTEEENRIIDSIFTDNTSPDKLLVEIKELIILLILFILVSMSKTTDIIKLYIPITSTSDWYLIIFKGIVLCCVFWFIKNIYLSRK